MRLFIAEKPSVARAIADALGTVNTKNKGYIECENDTLITWAYGHMYQLADPDFYLPENEKKKWNLLQLPILPENEKKKWNLLQLPIFPENFKILPNPTAKEQLKIIKELLEKADSVVNAGDPDREGQLLIDEILEENKYKGSIKRYWANAVDEKTVRTALNNISDNAKYEGLSLSAKARAHADWLLGMNLTRAYSVVNNALTAVGRVKTPTLRLVYDRDQQIKNFKPIDYYLIKANFSNTDNEYEAELVVPETMQGIDSENRIIDKMIARGVLDEIQGKLGTVANLEKKEAKIVQPLGLSLAEIQAQANSKYGLSAQDTLDIAQSLYEKKLTSYPRTDCRYLPTSQKADIESTLEAITKVDSTFNELITKTDKTISTKIWNDEKTTAHHAIVPVYTAITPELTENEAQVYKLIAQSYIAQFFPECTQLKTKITTEVKGYTFICNLTTILNLGWRAVIAEPEEEKEKVEVIPKITDLKAGDHVVTVAKFIKTQTKPPKHYTEGTLIKAMENIYKYIDDEEAKKLLKDGDGIGTPATRSSIIDQLKKQGYLTLQKKVILSTDTAENLLNSVSPDVQSAILTAQTERLLHEIAEGADPAKFYQEIKEMINNQLQDLSSKQLNNTQESKLRCPRCNSQLRIINGAYICSNGDFKTSCVICSAQITEDILEAILNEGISPELSFIRKKIS